MLKQIYKAALVAGALLVSGQAFAVGQAWKVEDDAVHRGLADIKTLLNTQISATSQAVGWEQRAGVVSSINSANVQSMHDLKQAELNAAPNLEKCIAVARSGSAAALAGASRAEGSLRQQLNVTQNTFGNTNFTNLTNYKGREELCSPADVRNGICDKPGKLAGWGEKVDSLRQNPVDKNLSLTPEQVEYGRQYIESSYALAPKPDGGGTKGATSTEYAAKRKLFLQRLSPSIAAANDQLSYSSGINLSQNPQFAKVWEDPEMKAAFQEILGKDVVRPTGDKGPSLREMERLMVLRPLYYSGDIVKLETATKEIDVMRQLAKQIAISNYLQMRTMNQMEHMNAQLKSINENQLMPIGNDINQDAATGK